MPSKYLYDAAGSLLFEEISDLPSYYLTRAERSILRADGHDIVRAMQRDRCVVADLGAGDGRKSRLLLEQLHLAGVDVTYAPIDVSADAIASVTRRLGAHLPWLRICGLVGEHLDALSWLAAQPGSVPMLVLFLGSSIGNLPHDDARAFLCGLRALLAPGDQILVGFDLMKDPSVLQSAYDDPRGVTARFNLNLLDRMNRELGADFVSVAFRHVARFDPRSEAMESYLMSTESQFVQVAGRRFDLAAWEMIQTEVSCKYRESALTEFGRAAQLNEVGRWFDGRRWFADVLWTVETLDRK